MFHQIHDVIVRDHQLELRREAERERLAGLARAAAAAPSARGPLAARLGLVAGRLGRLGRLVAVGR